MDSSFESIYSSSSSSEDFSIRKTKSYQQRITEDYYDDQEFRNRFRLNKSTVQYIKSLIEPEVKHDDNRGLPMSVMQKLMLTLRYYATGCFQTVSGDLFGVTQPTACTTINEISRAIARLSKEFIYIPTNVEEKSKVILDLYSQNGIPQCIGCIDCTHVPIVSPGGDNAEIFRNRKNYFSINVQGVCDANLRFLDFVARWHGSAHDQTIFNFSSLKNRFENGEFENCILLGDKGYGCKKYLITPYRNPRNRMENAFNKAHSSTRVCIERAFGVWKKRFPVLKTASHMKLENYLVVLVATAVIHNIAQIFNDPDDFEDEPSVYDCLQDQDIVPISSENFADTDVRDMICRRF